MKDANGKHRMCSRCILDTADDPEIVFDERGVCNHCLLYDRVAKDRLLDAEQRERKLASILEEIKAAGRKSGYDCVVGVSGGVDSSYVAYLAKEFGLRPLVVHCDNGWNSELAVNNIENIVKRLGYDLYTYVIDWEEFKDLQLSYLKASVVDIEAVTDHAIVASLYKVAAGKGIKYILSGENMATEGILPSHWVHNKNDLMNIKAIHRRFGSVRLKTFPTLGFMKKLYYQRAAGIRYVPILDLIEYVKEDAKRMITEELGWRDYGGKHYESIFTRFYQSYILPVKFGIDKRKSHLSTLVCSGQMTRQEALERIKSEIINNDVLVSDKVYVIKKFGLTLESFEAIMALPPRKHTEYRSILNVYRKLKPVTRLTTPGLRRRLVRLAG
ncbi:MAG TPA: N-acetyl sugar amidotransferase [Blastocatellia bacterium]|nr:N-acetyl sugar amidotransferase [Blastocatellia bacterium]